MCMVLRFLTIIISINVGKYLKCLEEGRNKNKTLIFMYICNEAFGCTLY